MAQALPDDQATTKSNGLETVTSADGTTIAYERIGQGKPVVLIGGAFNDRSTVAGLAAALATTHTAITYDRRGRGDSGDSDSYTVQRELDDVAALIDALGTAVSLFGHSSGGNLALEAAAQGLAVDKLVVYEPAYVADDSRPRPPSGLVDQVRAMIDQDRRDEAATLFLTEQVAVPEQMVDGMRSSPMWGWFTALAHTLPYDMTLAGPDMAVPADRLAGISVPTLAIGGGESPPWLRASARAVADVIPGARYVTLQGQDHGVLNQPDALAPLLTGFLAGQ